LQYLPFPDETFEFVVSSDVLGHIRIADKDQTLAEIWRVLRPGGLTLHYIEAEGTDPLMRFAQSYPELYRQHIIEPEGHVGLEAATAIFNRFRRNRFIPLQEMAVYRGPVYIQRFVQYFDNEYRGKSGLISTLVRCCKVLSAAGPVAIATNLGITALIELADRVCPSSWAGGALVCYQKQRTK
jgi:ubiquinone/menaquinone biosynthesis C-methylase UbiE